MIKGNKKFLIHNFLHPIAGICWYLGFEKLGDRIHNIIKEVE